MALTRRRHLRLVPDPGGPPPSASLRTGRTDARSTPMTETAVELVVHRRSDQAEVSLSETVRAIFEGRDDPDGYILSISPAANTSRS